jgi:hypothetical protein
MRFRSRSSFMIVAALLFVGCRLLTGPDMCDPTDAAVIIGATRGTHPEFTWIPDCAVISLTVKRWGESRYLAYPVWKVSNPGAIGIESGVLYGEAPSGSGELCGNPSWEPYRWREPEFVPCSSVPESLIAGTEYIVELYSSVPYSDSGFLRRSGYHSHTWIQSFVP